MGKAMKIVRRSIHAFFQSYHPFASTAVFLVFPFSFAVLISQSFIFSSPIYRAISSRLRLLFEAAGFPASSQFLSLLDWKLSQTIFSFILTLPFAVTFLVLAKVSIIQIINESPRHRLRPPRFSSLLHLYPSLMLTHLFNSLAVVSANAAVFSVVFLAFNTMDILQLSSSYSNLALSAAGVILYSVVLPNTMVACNLAIVVSAVENSSWYHSILKALVLIQGRKATAITLALPASLGMAAIEALFQCRVMRPYRSSRKLNQSVVSEAFLIAYIYSLLIVYDTIVTCMFHKSLRKSGSRSSWNGYDHQTEIEPDKDALQV